MRPGNIRQLTSEPVFRATETDYDNLSCSSGCGQILVENFIPDCFAGVRIECFKCSAVTETPSFPLGEVIPSHIIRLSEGASFGLTGPIDYHESLTLAADEDIARSIELTTPKENTFEIKYDKSGISSLIDCYQAVTGADIDLQERIIRRGGRNVRAKFSFMYAALHMIEAYDPFSLETAESIDVLNMFANCYAAWSHHPRFSEVAQQLAKPGSFYHTAFTFMTAHYLFRSGNKIGLSLEDKHGEPNPDLYLRNANPEKSYIEVKAPQAVQAGGQLKGTVAGLTGAFTETLKRSSGQINVARPGVLVIASSYIGDDISIRVNEARENVIRSTGGLKKGLAGIVTIVPSSPWTGTGVKRAYAFATSVNLNFDGPNPLRT